MIQRLEYSFTFNPSLLTIPKRKQQVAEILKEAETYIWRIKMCIRDRYEDAGMSIEVIQAMYEYDWSVFNAARSYQNHTQEITAPSFEQGEESYSPLMNKYQEAISVTEHYRETKSRFTWIGEIENERLLSALENLSDADLNLVTMYAYEGYTVTEISKVLGVAQPTISIKIKRITKFLKNFNFNAMD